MTCRAASTKLSLLACAIVLSTACGPSYVTATGKPKTQTSGSEYSVTQVNAAKPERGGKPQDTPLALEPTQDARPSEGCDAEACEGELSSTARQQLVQAVARVSECYETELKNNAALEGRFSVLVRLPGESAKTVTHCPPTIESSNLTLSPGFSTCLAAALSKVEARGKGGCVDVAVPLHLVRQEVEAPADSSAAPSNSSTGSGAPPPKPAKPLAQPH